MSWKLIRSQEPGKETTDAAPAPEPLVNGFFRGREQLISGWVLDLKDNRQKHEVEIFVGDRKVGAARADRFDSLVQSQHGGDGNYGFAFFYDGDLSGETVEASVKDRETGTALRSKQPLVTRGLRAGQPLAIDKLTIGKKIVLTGRIGNYPWGKDLGIEFWAGDERVVSSVPVTPLGQAEGSFSADVSGEALKHLLSGNVEVALPGLKEAGLAVPFDRPPLFAAVSLQERNLRIELKGDFEQSGPIALAVRLGSGAGGGREESLNMRSRVSTLVVPAGFELTEGSVEVSVGNVAIPTRIEWQFLEDLQFGELGADGSPWRLSAGATAERGFFAFPASLANQHDLSGYIAHISRTEGSGSLLLSQQLSEVPKPGQRVQIAIFARSAKKAKIELRLRDDQGILTEQHVSSRSGDAWNLLRLQADNLRPVTGPLMLEIEASGRGVEELDVAMGNSTQSGGSAPNAVSSNLLANDGFSDWPQGAGVQKHSIRGDICAGWRVFNRKSRHFTFSRAVMHPVDSSLGIAVAAPEVSHYLRLEADFSISDIAGQALTLRFRAGLPHSARQLLSNESDAVPQFAVIDRVYVLRRRRVTTSGTYQESDEVAGVFARKVPIGWDIETHEYTIPELEDGDFIFPDDAQQVDESYHLAFDFRHPTVIALFDVEVVGSEDSEPAKSETLSVEDRNIAMQIDTLEALAHWRGPTPVRLVSRTEQPAADELKWKYGPSVEPVEVIVPVFNALDETLGCLDSLAGSTSVPMLVRVIDDGSDAPVRVALEEYARGKPWISVESLGTNRGYTYAADYGIRQAGSKWIVLLNSDTIVTRGWIEGMLACARSDPKIAFVGPLSNAASYQSVPKLYDAARKWKTNRLPEGMSAEDMAAIVRRVSHKSYPYVPLLNGFCTLMNRAAFIELGGLNPGAFPTGYGEENDLCLRAGKAGLKLAVADDVYVYHVKSASFGSARRSDLTKAGNNALKTLHPDVDISALTAGFRETPALVAIREAVAAELSKLQPGLSDPEADSDVIEDSGEQAGDDPQPELQKA